MRVLVAGATGQIARSLAAIRDGAYDVVTVGRPALDLTDAASIARAFAEAEPDVAINAAAYTAVDQAESEEKAAFDVNVQGARLFAEQAHEWHTPLIHLSSDYVFDGCSGTAYVEDDETAPTSAYGRTKLAGELAVRQAHPQSIVVRTAWVVSPYGQNFCKTMLRLATTHPCVRVVADQIGSPTYAPHLAQALLDIAAQLVKGREKNPLRALHLANGGHASWFEVAEAVMAAARDNGLAAVPVEAITTAEYPTPARRPANSRLDCSKAQRHFGVRLPHWRDGVTACVGAIAEATRVTADRRA